MNPLPEIRLDSIRRYSFALRLTGVFSSSNSPYDLCGRKATLNWSLLGGRVCVRGSHCGLGFMVGFSLIFDFYGMG